MLLVEFDRIDYALSLNIQHRIVDLKLARGTDDVLLLLEHPSTVTLGMRGSVSDLLVPEDDLAARGISVHTSDRGGQATYHGPGQIVAYPIVALKGLGLSVRAYVFALEETIVQTLQRFGIKGSRRDRSAGIWVGPDEKIASIGVKIRRGIAFHGFSLNVDLQEDPARFVVCCGAECTRMVSMNRILAEPVSAAHVRTAIADAFSQVFRVPVVPCPVEEYLARIQTEAGREMVG